MADPNIETPSRAVLDDTDDAEGEISMFEPTPFDDGVPLDSHHDKATTARTPSQLDVSAANRSGGVLVVAGAEGTSPRPTDVTKILRQITKLQNALPTQGEVTELFARNKEGAHELMHNARLIENEINELKLILKQRTTNRQHLRDIKYEHVKAKQNAIASSKYEKWKDKEKRSHEYIVDRQAQYQAEQLDKKGLRSLMALEADQTRQDLDTVRKLTADARVEAYKSKVNMIKFINHERELKRRLELEQKRAHELEVSEKHLNAEKQRVQQALLRHEDNLMKMAEVERRAHETLQFRQKAATRMDKAIDDTVEKEFSNERWSSMILKYQRITAKQQSLKEKQRLQSAMRKEQRERKLQESLKHKTALEEQKKQQRLDDQIKYYNRCDAFEAYVEEQRRQRSHHVQTVRREQALRVREDMQVEDEARRAYVLEKTRERVGRIAMSIRSGEIHGDQEPQLLPSAGPSRILPPLKDKGGANNSLRALQAPNPGQPLRPDTSAQNQDV